MSERKYWLGFSQVKGIGPRRTQALIDNFGTLAEAWRADDTALERAGLDQRALQNLKEIRKQIDLEAEIARLDKLGIALITWDDPEYPANLTALKDTGEAPPVLFVRGTLLDRDEWSIAVVGSRAASAYGKAVTESITRDLAGNGITIISGLARGIDSEAHQATLEAGGRTIAVLACGLDRIYPPENRQLAAKIMRQGALVSSFPVGSEPDGMKFPVRNRIMSGLAKGVLVTEAADKSGALITAEAALDQGREVFAVPGNITSRSSMGVNRLIQDGAHPVMSADDIMAVLSYERQVTFAEARKSLPEMSDIEKIILEYLAEDPVHIDQIARDTQLSITEVSSGLTLLQLKGLVKDMGGRIFTRQ